jgi:hypothetical protein
MDIVSIKNKLIVLKTYRKISNELTKEIEDAMLNKTKIEDFEKLLSKVESGLTA